MWRAARDRLARTWREVRRRAVAEKFWVAPRPSGDAVVPGCPVRHTSQAGAQRSRARSNWSIRPPGLSPCLFARLSRSSRGVHSKSLRAIGEAGSAPKAPTARRRRPSSGRPAGTPRGKLSAPRRARRRRPRVGRNHQSGPRGPLARAPRSKRVSNRRTASVVVDVAGEACGGSRIAQLLARGWARFLRHRRPARRGRRGSRRPACRRPGGDPPRGAVSGVTPPSTSSRNVAARTCRFIARSGRSVRPGS